jgi:hypothetical protein
MTTATTKWEVLRDGNVLVVVETSNAAFEWLLRNQGQSVHYATTWGGYQVRERIPTPMECQH